MKKYVTSYQHILHLLEKLITLGKDNNKYHTTGTRVYQCTHLEQHIPRHVYEFGRYLRIRYDSQPTTVSSTKPQQMPQKTLYSQKIKKTRPKHKKIHHQIYHKKLQLGKIIKILRKLTTHTNTATLRYTKPSPTNTNNNRPNRTY